MRLGNRAFFALLGGVSAVLIGCGGGGGGGSHNSMPTVAPTQTSSATATPTAIPTATQSATATSSPFQTPVPVSPTAAPTPGPTGTAIGVTSRPLNNGDTFAYAGNYLETLVYRGQTPNPAATVAYAIAQTVTDEGMAPFDGATPFDLRTSETDTQTSPAKTTTSTTDAFYASSGLGGGQTGFYTYGFTSSNSEGEDISDTLSNVGFSGGFNGLIDVLPETAKQTWTNTEAATIAESESDGFTSNRTYAANGTYTENDLYPQSSQFTPSPSPLTATITENSDGSGTYNLPITPISPPNVNITYSAGSGGTITITATQGSNSQTYTVNTWYPLPLSLYSETDVDDGAITLPAACNVPAQFGALGNGVEQKSTRVDTILGTIDYFDQITYVIGGYDVCVTLNDTTYEYYDYSGQGNEAPLGISFSGGNSPLDVVTTTSTIGLTSTSVSGASHVRNARGLESTSGRVAIARTSFLAALERRRLDRRDRALRRLRTLRFAGTHR